MAPSIAVKCAAEFLGTFLLVFTVGCNVLGDTGLWGVVSVASVLMVAIYSLGAICGANFNPAVSVCLGITKSLGGPGMDWKTVGLYCIVQLLAGLGAALSASALFGQIGSSSLRAVVQPGSGFSWMGAGSCELLYTCMLCFVILNVAAATKNCQEVNQYFGLAISSVIVAGGYAAGPVSGGCFNPALALAADATSTTSGFGWSLAYMGFQLLGAVLAAGLFWLVRPSDFGQTRSFSASLASEFIGTFFLVLTVGLNVLGKSPATAFSVAAALTSMVYSLGDVSGAHFNPAVTTAIETVGRNSEFGWWTTLCYVSAQEAAGQLAGFIFCTIWADSFPLGPATGKTWLQAAIAEFVFSFLLCFVVLAVAVSKTTKTSQMFGLAIGACVTIGGAAVGGISGASLNPAVSLGISTGHAYTSIDASRFQILAAAQFAKARIYDVCEVAGALAAAWTFHVTHYVDTEVSELKAFA